MKTPITIYLFTALAVCLCTQVYAQQNVPEKIQIDRSEYFDGSIDETVIDDETAEKLLLESGIQAPQNQEFTPYHVKDLDVTTIVPVKLAIAGTDPLSLNFLKRNAQKLQNENITVLLIGNRNVLQQFKSAYPHISVQRYDLNPQLQIMLGGLGVRYYPALYDNGMVTP